MKASVLIMTYNQEAVIGQTIESVLTQVTDFDYEIVVAEDCSTDRTRSIVCDYRDRFPDYRRAERREVFKDAVKIILHERQKCAKLRMMLRGYVDYRRGRLGLLHPPPE